MARGPVMNVDASDGKDVARDLSWPGSLGLRVAAGGEDPWAVATVAEQVGITRDRAYGVRRDPAQRPCSPHPDTGSGRG